MNQREKEALDRHITGNYGEDQFDIQDPIFEAILEERTRQDELWGVQDYSHLCWLAILMEEVGEAAKAILDISVKGQKPMEEEIVQVAAVAVAWLENISRRTRPR